MLALIYLACVKIADRPPVPNQPTAWDEANIRRAKYHQKTKNPKMVSKNEARVSEIRQSVSTIQIPLPDPRAPSIIAIQATGPHRVNEGEKRRI